MQHEIVKEHFDKTVASYKKSYQEILPSFKIRRAKVYELLNNCPCEMVLDAGCGPGVMLEENWNTKKMEFYGIDIAEEMIALCKQQYGHLPNVHFEVGNIEKLNFPDDYFDCIICMGVLEYLDDYQSAVKEMKRVVKKGGVIIMTLPNKFSPYRLYYHNVYMKIGNLVKKCLKKPVPKLIFHREFTEKRFLSFLKHNELFPEKVVYYNFRLIVSPFDVVLPRATKFFSNALEFLETSVFRWLGTGFIVKAKK